MTVELEYVPQPIPIYMIGESHCVVFTDRIFRETKHLGETFITRAMYLPGISSHDFVVDGQMHRVMGALAAEHLIVGDPRGEQAVWVPMHTATNNLHIPSVHSKKPRGVPVLVVFAGEIALRSIFLRQLGNADFELPFEAPYLDELPAPEGAQTVPLQLVFELANRALLPLVDGLTSLYNMGFTSVYLHCVPPPTLDDEEFQNINGFYSPVRLRYKSALFFNRVLKDTCTPRGIRFLDIWDEVTVRGKLNPEFHVDGTHLNVKAAYITLNTLLDSVVNETRAPIAARYAFGYSAALEQAGPALPEASHEVSQALLPAESLDGIRAGLDFSLESANDHVRLDWSGSSVGRWSEHILTARPTDAAMHTLYDVLYGSPLARTLRERMRCDYAALSVRPFRAEPHPESKAAGPEQLHRDAAPAGVLRCLVYLSDVDEGSGPFQYRSASDQLKDMPGPAGTVLLFDGNAFEHRWKPPSKTFRDILDISLVPRHPRLGACVVWPGMNSWPVDPYNFSTTDFVCYPEGSHVKLAEDSSAWWKKAAS